MIIVKNAKELTLHQRACEISAAALKAAGRAVKPGVTTAQIESAAVKVIEEAGAYPSFYKYNGFPGKICISINDTVIHGIAGKDVIKDGDLVSIDVGAYIGGFHGDNAATYIAGEGSDRANNLAKVTKEALYKAIEAAVVGNRVGDISYAIQSYVEAHGYSAVTQWVGHGIGRELHEDPQVPCVGTAGKGPRLTAGMTLAIEPMINEKSADTNVLKDGWTVKTVDRGLSAHFEHTIAITSKGAKILTLGWEEGEDD